MRIDDNFPNQQRQRDQTEQYLQCAHLFRRCGLFAGEQHDRHAEYGEHQGAAEQCGSRLHEAGAQAAHGQHEVERREGEHQPYQGTAEHGAERRVARQRHAGLHDHAQRGDGDQQLGGIRQILRATAQQQNIAKQEEQLRHEGCRRWRHEAGLKYQAAQDSRRCGNEAPDFRGSVKIPASAQPHRVSLAVRRGCAETPRRPRRRHRHARACRSVRNVRPRARSVRGRCPDACAR